MRKSLTLCADDFGLTPEICEGIIELAQNSCIDAASCMVTEPDFITYAQDLKACHDKVEIGLHFNLTEGQWLTQNYSYGLYPLILRTQLRLISRKKLEAEFLAQINKFREVMGFEPDFIDGHQHVHQFPVIRDAVLKIYESEFKTHKPWVRCTYPSLDLPEYRWKGFILAWTGGKAFKRKLLHSNIPHPKVFSGIYDFNPKVQFSEILNRWRVLIKDGGLVMCHPARPDFISGKQTERTPKDKLTNSRINEFLALNVKEKSQPIIPAGFR